MPNSRLACSIHKLEGYRNTGSNHNEKYSDCVRKPLRLIAVFMNSPLQ